MFKPDEIIFAITSACNLACSHCTVSKNKHALDVQAAKHLITACKDFEIERIGFSGGEPFLEPKLLNTLIVCVRENELLFDRIMTNGIWYKSEEELEQVLSALFDAGYDGTICVSFDSYHAQNIESLTIFMEAVFKASGNKESLELSCVFDEDPAENKEILETLANRLDGMLECDVVPYRIVDDSRLRQEARGAFDGSGMYIPITYIRRSRQGDALSWDDTEWFTDDYCEGPGHVLYVHTDGRIAVCCGFANEHDQLIVGTVADTLAEVLERADSNDYVRYCYSKGLGELRKSLEQSGYKFKGKTRDICGFCDFVCRNNLEKLVGPPGFEPGTNGL